MSDSIQAAVSVPFVRQLADGSEYTFSPIGPASWSKFCVWLNSRQGQKPNRLVGLEEMMEATQTVDGMLWLCWHAAEKNHKGLKKAEFDALLAMTDLSEILPSILDLPEDEGSPDPPEGPPSTG